jgi:hypothetical protein
MQKLKKSLTCLFCSHILKDPIELPCKDSICQEHLKEISVIKQNKIKCLKCLQEFKVNACETRPANIVIQLLSDQVYLSDEEKALKLKIDESIFAFYETHENYISCKNVMELECHNHFQEVRRKIDLHREKLKEKIDDIYMNIIEETKLFEASYLKFLNEKISASFQKLEIRTVEEELQEIEKMFRDPNILIESIREINLKQQDLIRSLQSKLCEMSLMRENIKDSMQFKPCVAFNKNSFGALSLKEFSIHDPFNSQILTGRQPFDLVKVCQFSLADKFSLLYRGSLHGFSADDFHLKCDGKAKTLTLVKSKTTSFIFGGYTNATWDGSGQYKSDPNGFLFSLTNNDNQPCKMKIRPNRLQTSILCNSAYGPIFGGGHDICISDNSNTTCDSHSLLGWTYKHAKYLVESNEAQSFLAGSCQFQLSEIEVYQKE